MEPGMEHSVGGKRLLATVQQAQLSTHTHIVAAMLGPKKSLAEWVIFSVARKWKR